MTNNDITFITENKDLNWTEDELKKAQKDLEKFNSEKRKALEYAEEKRRKQELKDIRRYGAVRSLFNAENITTTKFFMIFILVNCSIIEIYSMVVMFVFNNLEPLSALIGAVIGESISFAIYCAKSYLGHKEEEIRKYENRKLDLENSTPTTDDTTTGDSSTDEDDDASDPNAEV